MTQILPLGVEYIRILPEIVLSIFGMAIMLLDPLVDERSSQRLLGLIALAARWRRLRRRFISRNFPEWFLGYGEDGQVQHFFHFVVTAITAVVILTSYEYMRCSRSGPGNITD